MDLLKWFAFFLLATSKCRRMWPPWGDVCELPLFFLPSFVARARLVLPVPDKKATHWAVLLCFKLNNRLLHQHTPEIFYLLVVYIVVIPLEHLNFFFLISECLEIDCTKLKYDLNQSNVYIRLLSSQDVWYKNYVPVCVYTGMVCTVPPPPRPLCFVLNDFFIVELFFFSWNNWDVLHRLGYTTSKFEVFQKTKTTTTKWDRKRIYPDNITQFPKK